MNRDIAYRTAVNFHEIHASIQKTLDREQDRARIRDRKKNLPLGWTRQRVAGGMYGFGLHHLRSGPRYQGRIAIWVGPWQFVRLLRTTQRDTPPKQETRPS